MIMMATNTLLKYSLKTMRTFSKSRRRITLQECNKKLKAAIWRKTMLGLQY